MSVGVGWGNQLPCREVWGSAFLRVTPRLSRYVSLVQHVATYLICWLSHHTDTEIVQ